MLNKLVDILIGKGWRWEFVKMRLPSAGVRAG